MNGLIHQINKLNQWTGILAGWLLVPIVLATLYNVIIRYYYGKFSIPISELVMIMNSMVFLLAAPLLLKEDKHVRVDVFYAKFNTKKKALVDCLGSLLLLLPFFGFVIYFSWDYVLSAWKINETSPQTGGIQGFYLFKSLIIIVSVLMILQSIALFLEKLLILCKPTNSQSPDTSSNNNTKEQTEKAL